MIQFASGEAAGGGPPQRDFDSSRFDNLGDDDGRLGDKFFANIEQIAAYAPYMVSIGNHEDSEPHISHYTERFRNMPVTRSWHAGEHDDRSVRTKNGLAPNNWYVLVLVLLIMVLLLVLLVLLML